MKIASWLFSIIPAVIYLQTLYFKFTAHEVSVHIFETVAGPGLEAFARVGSGVAELITAILLLVPATRIYGAILSIAVISGAILSHFAFLGIVVKDDGGSLFILACVVLVSSAIVAYLHRSELPLSSSKA